MRQVSSGLVHAPCAPHRAPAALRTCGPSPRVHLLHARPAPALLFDAFGDVFAGVFVRGHNKGGAACLSAAGSYVHGPASLRLFIIINFFSSEMLCSKAWVCVCGGGGVLVLVLHPPPRSRIPSPPSSSLSRTLAPQKGPFSTVSCGGFAREQTTVTQLWGEHLCLCCSACKPVLLRARLKRVHAAPCARVVGGLHAQTFINKV